MVYMSRGFPVQSDSESVTVSTVCGIKKLQGQLMDIWLNGKHRPAMADDIKESDLAYLVDNGLIYAKDEDRRLLFLTLYPAIVDIEYDDSGLTNSEKEMYRWLTLKDVNPQIQECIWMSLRRVSFDAFAESDDPLMVITENIYSILDPNNDTDNAKLLFENSIYEGIVTEYMNAFCSLLRKNIIYIV